MLKRYWDLGYRKMDSRPQCVIMRIDRTKVTEHTYREMYSHKKQCVCVCVNTRCSPRNPWKPQEAHFPPCPSARPQRTPNTGVSPKIGYSNLSQGNPVTPDSNGFRFHIGPRGGKAQYGLARPGAACRKNVAQWQGLGLPRRSHRLRQRNGPDTEALDTQVVGTRSQNQVV